MARKFNTLGLMLTAVFALCLASASASSAAEFHSAGAPATISGTQSTSHVFTTSAGTLTCKTATFSGTQSAKTATSITLTPTYKDCSGYGLPFGITVYTNGCAFIFNANGATELECPSGKEVEIDTLVCRTLIKPQTFASGMSYSTNGSSPNRTITAATNISGIKYSECSGKELTNGTYKGTTTITGSAGEVWYA